MPDRTQTATRKDSSSFRQLWLNHRRKRFWALLAVLLYTLSGFFLAPALVRHYAVQNIEASTGRDANIDRVRVNPYVLSMEVHGFGLDDSDGEPLVAFDVLRANFQLSSLFRRAWTFRELRLDGAYALYERFAPDDDRFMRLAADMERLNPSQEEPAPPGPPPRLLVHELTINEGAFTFLDHAPGETVDLSAEPISITVNDLNTLPDRDGTQQVQIRLNRDALLTWQGLIHLHPLRSSGRLSLEGLNLDPLLPYLDASLPLDSLRARFSLDTDYAMGIEDGHLTLQLSSLESQLAEVAVSGLTPSTDFLALDALEVSGGTLDYPENSIGAASIRLSNPFVDAWLGEDGQAGLAQLVPEDGTSGSDSEESKPWQVSVGEFVIAGGKAALTDRSIEPSASLLLENLALKLSAINNRDNAVMPFSLGLDLAGGGSAGFEGEVSLLPSVTLSAAAKIDSVPLAIAQPYVQQHLALAIGGGSLNLLMDAALGASGEVGATGEMNVSGLQLTDTVEDQPLLAWENMVIDRFEVDSAAASAHISSVRFAQPFGRVQIREDLSTNLDGLSADSETPGDSGEAMPPGQDEAGWNVIVGGIAIDDGSLAFSDLSLPLPFAANISRMDGTVSTIDSASARPAEIRLEGQVDEYGMARIGGSMNLLDPIAHTDVEMEFRNLEMTRLSPYTVQFAGHEIAEGKLDLDLGYGIENGQLNGQNAIVLSDLELGDKVDHPDAASLPLGLAIALLKDSNGVIDIDLPVEGDVNDPEFRIGGAVWKAFAGLITKVVAAPFKLLGSLIGVDSEDFGQFQFLAGRYDLTPPELEKISQLQQALAKRPELTVEISGVYDPAVDRPALQYLSLKETVWTRLGRNPTEQGDSDEMLDQEILGMFEELYSERFPESSLADLKASHSALPADNPEGQAVLDRTAYSGALRDRLVESEPIGEPALVALATQRAQAVMDAFLEDGSLDPARVRLGEPAVTDPGEGEWVVMELGVAVD
jgi:hypothetical protein